MTTVVHLCRKNGKVVQDCDIYIGRMCTMGGWDLKQSKWANPFKPEGKTKEDYEACIQKYREWIVKQPELMGSLEELRGKCLGCWCKPFPCHGDILVELLKTPKVPYSLKGTWVAADPAEVGPEYGDRPILFYETHGEYGFLTNFSPFVFEIDDEKYLTTEHYYQVMKFRYDGASEESLEYANIIQACSTPTKAKALGHQQPHRFGGNWPVNERDKRKINDLVEEFSDLSPREDWEEQKVKVMYDCLKIKFDPDDEYYDRLPKNTYFVEHTTRDKYWADGGDGGDGTKGQNFLGRLITLIVNEEELSEKLKKTIGYEELIEKINL